MTKNGAENCLPVLTVHSGGPYLELSPRRGWNPPQVSVRYVRAYYEGDEAGFDARELLVAVAAACRDTGVDPLKIEASTEQALAVFFNCMLDAFLDHVETVDQEDLKEALVLSGLGTAAGYGAGGAEYMGVALTDLGQSVRRTAEHR